MIVRAKVNGGRPVLNEATSATNLPEGAEVELVVVDGDHLDDDDRARLHAALDEADEELRAGRGIPGAQVIADLRAGKL